MRAIRIALFVAVAGGCARLFAQVPQIDYAVSLAPAGAPIAGGEVVYGIVVTANYWTDTAEPFVVRMTVPRELEIASHCSGEPDAELSFDPTTRVLTWSDRLDNPYIALLSCPLTFRVSPEVAPGTAIEVTATLTTSAPDPNPANNTVSHVSVVLAASDLAVDSAADPIRFTPGTPLTYTFTVANRGPQDAVNVAVVAQLSMVLAVQSFQQLSGPPATLDPAPRDTGAAACLPPRCGVFIEANIPLLPVGSSATFRLVALTKPFVEASTIVNRVVAESSSVDPMERDNEKTLISYVGPNADLAAANAIASDATPLRIPVTVTVSNAGPDPVGSVTVQNILTGTRYDLVDLARYVSAVPSQGTCSEPERVYPIAELPPPPYWSVRCALGTLAPGATATIALVVERASADVRIDHIAVVAPGENDPRPQNNLSRVTITTPAPRRRTATK